jgi:hypothetical protein
MTIFNLDIGIINPVLKFTVICNISIISKDNPRGTNRSIRACAPYRPDIVAPCNLGDVPASMVPFYFLYS